MPRFRRSGLGTIINSVKHVIDSEGVVQQASPSLTPLATAVAARSTTFNPEEVEVGDKINGFFLSVFGIGASGQPFQGSWNWYIMKIHEGQIGDVPTPGQTGTSKLRNQIFHEEKGVPGSGDGTPVVFKGVIAVPRGMRRMREGDQFLIRIAVTSMGDDANFCIKAIYKTFS